MSLLVFLVVVAVLVMWATYHVPADAPIWAKNVAYIMVLPVAMIVTLSHVGLLAVAR